MQTDQACRQEAAKESGALDYSVVVTSEGGHDVVHVDREMSSERIPDFVRKLIGNRVHVKQTERWSSPRSDGSRTAELRVNIKGHPAHMDATLTFTPDGTSTKATLEGELKVSIPIIGRKIEPEIARAVLGALHVDQRVGLRWLESNA
jgi:hypothetical protein